MPISPTDEFTCEDRTVSARLEMPPEKLLQQLSFTHFIELLRCADPLKRVFCEVECIRGNWSVRELKRQISSLYYERSGLSTDKKKLADMDDNLFVSKYQLELPKKEEMQSFIEAQMSEWKNDTPATLKNRQPDLDT